MIKANELRIGNWVTLNKYEYNFNVNPFTKKIVGSAVIQVDEIDGESESINKYIFSWGEVESNSCEYLEGIPLTPEILEKVGFEAHGEDGEYNYPDIAGVYLQQRYLDDDGFDYYCFKQWLMTVNYLHQLQNLFFALTGTELEYNP